MLHDDGGVVWALRLAASAESRLARFSAAIVAALSSASCLTQSSAIFFAARASWARANLAAADTIGEAEPSDKVGEHDWRRLSRIGTLLDSLGLFVLGELRVDLLDEIVVSIVFTAVAVRRPRLNGPNRHLCSAKRK